MKTAIGLVALLAVAVGSALVVGSNQASVTFFWSPYRMDVSLNLFLLVSALVFVVLHLAWRAVGGLFELPREARRWRMRQQERAMHGSLLMAQTQLMAGRYIRARTLALAAIEHERILGRLQTAEDPGPAHATEVRHVAHLLVAECAHALQDRTVRDQHAQLALQVAAHLPKGAANVAAAQDAVHLNAARWSLVDREPTNAMLWLAKLPLGSVRRTVALRLKLKAARLSQDHRSALETARLLAKHGAFAAEPARSLVRGLLQSVLSDCHDQGQLVKVWQGLDASEQTMPEVAVHAAQRLLAVQGEPSLALVWVQPVWRDWVQSTQPWSVVLSAALVEVIEQALQRQAPSAQWLTWVEQARLSMPRHRELQYLAGMVCMQHALWGKAQQMLAPLAAQLVSPDLQRKAYSALAALAEQRGDSAVALTMWKHSAQVGQQPP
jgi:HemY protein